MPGAYASVKGTALAGLIHETRSLFIARPPVATYDPQLANSLRLVALEAFAGKPKHDKLEILGDVMETDADLPIEREPSEIFPEGGTAGSYVQDLVCEIVCQALYLDADTRAEDERRQVVAKNVS